MTALARGAFGQNARTRFGLLALACSAAFGALAACGPKTHPSASGQACPDSGGRLEVTGLCEAQAWNLLADIDPALDKLAVGCAWRLKELATGPGKALIFRRQDCSKEGWGEVRYAFADMRVKRSVAANPQGAEVQVLEILPFEGSAQDFLARTRNALDPSERAQCEIVAIEDGDGWENRFRLAPNEPYEKELAKGGEAAAACGPYGLAEAEQFFEIKGQEAWFWRLDQDSADFDPRSMTRIEKAESGAWRIADK